MTCYTAFLRKKEHEYSSGFDPLWMPDFLFDFQVALLNWSIQKGRAAVFADCGLGKTPMQLVWCRNAHMKSGKPSLLATPLAVGYQTVREAKKFSIDAEQSRDGKHGAPIVITNYQQLHKFSPDDFGAFACDESSILKNFDGAIRGQVTDFMRKLPYRSLWTATAAPNDYIELGTSSEAIGDLGFVDMVSRFFKKIEKTYSRSQEFASGLYRFRGHAQEHFWRWVCSWARMIRKPSDLGFSDDNHVLPELIQVEHTVKAKTPNPEALFDMPAVGLAEQREERRRTLRERCEMAAALVADTGRPAVAWCQLNAEGALLEKLIPGAVEVDGNDSDEFKEETFKAFADGEIRVLISKPVIAGFGLNWQHCSHQTFFPSHSFEQWYQGVRRSWRFGQKNPVRVDVITSEGERGVIANLKRKMAQADEMFRQLVQNQSNHLNNVKVNPFQTKEVIPQWLS